jgi:pimeloyl-ACP methyl ester carboxylesterase
MREDSEEFQEGALRVHRHGSSGPTLIVLHGGPAAAGEAAPIARGLSGTFRVLEPWQRGSGAAPLSVAVHVADLFALVRSRCDPPRPALVGESWGAMLALAYAAAHPAAAGPLVLVGCGTFDPVARARMRAILEERTDSALRQQLARLPVEIRDPEERLRRQYELTEHLYLYDPLAEEDGPARGEPLDVRAHIETWNDMLRLQREGIYPAAFAAIRSPVLMLHGAYDPHPGAMIRASLEPFLPQLEYREWRRCGHSPWREKAVRAEFFRTLRDWLEEQLARSG